MRVILTPRPYLRTQPGQKEPMCALAFTFFEEIPILRGFPVLYREAGWIGGPEEEPLLCRRSNADVEGHSPPVDPVGDVDVCGPRKGTSNEVGSFLLRVKTRRRELRILEYFVPDPVVTSTMRPLIVATMDGLSAE